MLEAAKALGYTTGLVVTSRVTHATPAGWSAHAVERDDEDLIAAQQIGDYTLGRQVDLMVGGGRGFFLPAGAPGSKRKDTRNLIQEATTKYGWKTYVENATQWRSVAEDSSSLPLLSLFHNSHMNYEIDRDDKVEPSLAETVKKSLKILKNASERCDSPGFFVMIEGSRLDHAAHSNDVATHVVENVAYQAAVKEVEAFVQHNPDTLALSTSDHETGGATVARQVNMSNPNIEYRWHPEAIFPVKASVEILAPLIRSEKSDLPNFVKKIVKDKMGLEITQTEVNAVIEARRLDVEVFKKDSYFTEWQLSELVNTRAEVGWTTHGHTGVGQFLSFYLLLQLYQRLCADIVVSPLTRCQPLRNWPPR
ncbi:alkaline-phosphatase-like protein [Paraphysoderma sedebokerense]|nr:alkaline-phosphatase-like protein [Paraphysoderma sedebokerense]